VKIVILKTNNVIKNKTILAKKPDSSSILKARKTIFFKLLVEKLRKISLKAKNIPKDTENSASSHLVLMEVMKKNETFEKSLESFKQESSIKFPPESPHHVNTKIAENTLILVNQQSASHMKHPEIPGNFPAFRNDIGKNNSEITSEAETPIEHEPQVMQKNSHAKIKMQASTLMKESTFIIDETKMITLSRAPGKARITRNPSNHTLSGKYPERAEKILPSTERPMLKNHDKNDNTRVKNTKNMERKNSPSAVHADSRTSRNVEKLNPAWMNIQKIMKNTQKIMKTEKMEKGAHANVKAGGQDTPKKAGSQELLSNIKAEKTGGPEATAFKRMDSKDERNTIEHRAKLEKAKDPNPHHRKTVAYLSEDNPVYPAEKSGHGSIDGNDRINNKPVSTKKQKDRSKISNQIELHSLKSREKNSIIDQETSRTWGIIPKYGKESTHRPSTRMSHESPIATTTDFSTSRKHSEIPTYPAKNGQKKDATWKPSGIHITRPNEKNENFSHETVEKKNNELSPKSSNTNRKPVIRKILHPRIENPHEEQTPTRPDAVKTVFIPPRIVRKAPEKTGKESKVSKIRISPSPSKHEIAEEPSLPYFNRRNIVFEKMPQQHIVPNFTTKQPLRRTEPLITVKSALPLKDGSHVTTHETTQQMIDKDNGGTIPLLKTLEKISMYSKKITFSRIRKVEHPMVRTPYIRKNLEIIRNEGGRIYREMPLRMTKTVTKENILDPDRYEPQRQEEIKKPVNDLKVIDNGKKEDGDASSTVNMKHDVITTDPTLSKSTKPETLIKQIVEKFIDIGTNIKKNEIITVKIQLHPPKLGEMNLEITRDEHGYRVVFNVTRKDSHDLLEKVIPMLRERLKDEGINDVRLEVHQRDQEEQRDYEQGERRDAPYHQQQRQWKRRYFATFLEEVNDDDKRGKQLDFSSIYTTTSGEG